MGGERPPGARAPGGVAPSARRRPGSPSVGLLASRARLRFTRRAESSVGGRPEQGQGVGQVTWGRGETAAAAKRETLSWLERPGKIGEQPRVVRGYRSGA